MSILSVILSWIKKHKRLSFELFLSVLTACSITYGTIVHNNNLTLSNSLEYALNNVEQYKNIVSNAEYDNNVLRMDLLDAVYEKDIVIQRLDSVLEQNKIKPKTVVTAATQTQSIVVTKGKDIKEYIKVLRDTVYTDSILYNKDTSIYYSIGNDSINVKLDIKNTLYLYTYKTREYQNKKNFWKRLITLDFKKVDKYKYDIVNTNDLLKESDIRIIEQYE